MLVTFKKVVPWGFLPFWFKLSLVWLVRHWWLSPISSLPPSHVHKNTHASFQAEVDSSVTFALLTSPLVWGGRSLRKALPGSGSARLNTIGLPLWLQLSWDLWANREERTTISGLEVGSWLGSTWGKSLVGKKLLFVLPSAPGHYLSPRQGQD